LKGTGSGPVLAGVGIATALLFFAGLVVACGMLAGQVKTR
jgi:hypothetical protein